METVLITGANRGIGLELCKQFLAAGNSVIATCRENADSSQLRALESAPSLSIYPLEVTDAKSVNQLVDQLDGKTIDVLINNAGVFGGSRQSVDDMDYAAWQTSLEVNTLAPFRLVVSLRKNLQLSSRPRVVTLSSQMGSLNSNETGTIAYRSSKAAVNKVMQVLANEFGEYGIIVCPVHPGWVRTDMGGSQADLSVEECGAGLFNLIDSLTMQQSGRFWTWEAKEIAW